MDVLEPQVRTHIRWMIRRDMPEVTQIERSTCHNPWCEEDFLRCLRQRNCIGMVAEVGEQVLGFMVYELHKARLHILNFGVCPHHRRSGVGTHMVRKLIGKLSSHRRTRVTLEVRESNLAAQLFFKGMGFRAVRVMLEWYEDTRESAYSMAYRLQTEVLEE